MNDAMLNAAVGGAEETRIPTVRRARPRELFAGHEPVTGGCWPNRLTVVFGSALPDLPC